MTMQSDAFATIRNHIAIPDHIDAIAGAIRYDLMHGPTFAIIRDNDITKFTADDFSTDYVCLEAGPSDRVVQTYASPLADALREFIDDLPSELWYDVQSNYFQDSEPTADVYVDADENGNTIEVICEVYWEDWMKLDRNDIVTSLFGKTIANEFR
jgi:hypothetical protein